MNAYRLITRSFFRKGQNNLIKIVSLGVGLAIGLVLIGKVYFEQSYDNFYPDKERIYGILANYTIGEDHFDDYNQVSGGVAPGMKAELPEVEVATRATLFETSTFYTADRKKLYGWFMLADTCLYDVLPRPVLAGNVKEVLSRPMYALVSRSIAEKMGGITAALGQTIEIDNRPGKVLTVGGVFEDLPQNASLKYDVLVSFSSMSEFFPDRSMEWYGGDRYRAFVKLVPGTDPESLAPSILKMQEKYQPKEVMEKMGVEIRYNLIPLTGMHRGELWVKILSALLGMLAFVVLFTAVMNYVLIAISSLVRRSKEMAVNRCYGASDKNIYGMMLLETGIHLVLSLLLASLLILACRGIVVGLLDTSLEALFSLNGCLVLGGVCLVVFFVSSLVPGYLYSRIPVSSAFRKYGETRRLWKLGLLFVQFVITGFLVTLLVIISLQYRHMIHSSPGYAYENLAYCDLSGVGSDSRRKALDEISSMPEVAAVSSCNNLLLNSPSGNMIQLPGDDRQLFNVADLETVGNGYLDLMEIPVIAGRMFRENAASSHEVMVNRGFVEKMNLFADWSDGAVGKSIWISGHSNRDSTLFTICGVYEDFRISAIGWEDERPTVMFYKHTPSYNLLVKYHHQTAEINEKVTKRLEALLPDKEIIVNSYPAKMVGMYKDTRKFRDSVVIGALVALIISLIGLIGYTNDEMNRRRKETAIRRVNGATVSEVLLLFMKDILRVAIPALLLAGGAAAYVTTKLMSRFSEKIPLSPLLFIACGLVVLVIIQCVVGFNCYRAATENPAESVKTE